MSKPSKHFLLPYFQLWAKVYMLRTGPVVVGVTGSVGKTSMKDAIASALAVKYCVGKSPKTYNSDIGIPLALLGLETGYRNIGLWIKNILLAPFRALLGRSYDYFVIEMGVDRPGDMDQNLVTVRPMYGVMGAMGATPAHQEFFVDAHAVIHEKRKLLEALPEEGRAFVYADDTMLDGVSEGLPCPVITFGIQSHAQVRVGGYELVTERASSGDVLVGFACTVHLRDESQRIVVRGALGEAHMYPLAVACAIAYECGVSLADAVQGLATYIPPLGRMRVFQGKSGSVLIDDTYNASPIAMHAALDTLHAVPARRRIACLADMKELGAKSTSEHETAGEHAGRVADVLLCVGEYARAMARGAERSGMRSEHIILCADAQEATEHMEKIITDGDVVLVKGSQAMRMERVTEALLADKNDVAQLTRQDWYWRRKA